jgi:hypothetical protein
MKTRRRGGGLENGEATVKVEEEDDDEDADTDEDDEQRGSSGRDYQPLAVAPDPEAEAAAAQRQERLRTIIQEMLRARKVGETFLQDGPCYQVSFHCISDRNIFAVFLFLLLSGT